MQMNFLSIVKIIIKSLIISFLPKSINKFFFGKAEFAFIANLRDLEDIPNSSRIGYFFAKKYINNFNFKWPLVPSRVEGFKSREGKEIFAWNIICPLTAKQIIENRKYAREKIIQCVRVAEKLGVKSVNLAAFTSIATRDGYDLLDKTKLNITTGNSYSAVIAIDNIYRAADMTGLNIINSTIAIVGAAGSVGMGCSKFLSSKVKKLILIDINIDGLRNLENELKESSAVINISNKIEMIKEADVVISATNALGRIIKNEYLKPCTIMIDASHPRNVSKELIRNRKDVLVIHSAIAKVNGLKTNFEYGLGKGEIFGCLGESLLMSWLNDFGQNLLGKVSLDSMDKFKNVADLVGMKAAPFRNAIGYVTEEQINFIKRMREKLA